MQVTHAVRAFLGIVSITAGLVACDLAERVPSVPPEVSQAAVFQAVAEWIQTEDDFPAPRVVFVMRAVEPGGDEVTPPLDATPASGPTPLFDSSLTGQALATISVGLGETHDVRPVSGDEEAQDKSAGSHLGCYPFLDDGALLTLGMPHETGDGGQQFAVDVQLFRNCEGALWTLEVTWNGHAYGVTDVLSTAHMIV